MCEREPGLLGGWWRIWLGRGGSEMRERGWDFSSLHAKGQLLRKKAIGKLVCWEVVGRKWHSGGNSSG